MSEKYEYRLDAHYDGEKSAAKTSMIKGLATTMGGKATYNGRYKPFGLTKQSRKKVVQDYSIFLPSWDAVTAVKEALDREGIKTGSPLWGFGQTAIPKGEDIL